MPMRVIFSDAHDVVAHNCEMAESVKPWSWRGTADEFAREFVPGDPDAFPRTAG
jgi:hypothetical protein